MERTHYGQHDAACFGCKLATVQFGNVMPPPERLTEQQRAKDLPAYNRLRNQGLQPKQTRGCAELETRAHSQFEIDMHKLVEPTLWKNTRGAIEDAQALVADGMQRAREAEVTVDQIREWKDKARADTPA